MKKLLTVITLLALSASVVPASVYAENSDEGKRELRDARKEMHQKIKEERKEFRQEVKEAKKEFKFDIKNLFKTKNASDEAKKKRGKAGHLIGAEITAINGSSFTVVKDGKTYTVNTSSATKLRRHFWGKSEANEFSVGNTVNVWGKWADENQTILDAVMMRNLSIMKRHGVFIGEVTSTGSGNFVIKSLNRGNQTVIYGSNTKFVNRKEQTITATDIKVGNKIRVKGLWDKGNSKITEVVQVKDFSLPERVKQNSASNAASPSPTASVTVTVTPTPSTSSGPTATPTP